MSYKIHKMPQYDEWYETQTEKSKFQIEKRLDKIKTEDHFGHIRDLEDGLAELKFNGGALTRSNVILFLGNGIILLLGGSKNGQDSDIRKAKNIIEKAKEGTKR
jgi:putative addiction module killer protein